jgi:magnesium transporter
MAMKRKHRARKRRSSPGTSPGLLNIDPNAPPSQIRVMSYGPDSLQEDDVPDAKAAAARVGKQPVTWINVDGLGGADVLTSLGEAFNLHTLALEDVVNVGQRPKVEEYDDSLFIVLHIPDGGGADGRTEQLSLFLFPNVILTFQERRGDCFEPVRNRIRQGRNRIRSSGCDYLAYALIDAAIDAFYPHLDAFGDHLIDLEGSLIDEAEIEVTQIHDIKRSLLALRGSIRPLREVTISLYRADPGLVSEQVALFFRDCQDHALQLIDQEETYRDLSTSLIELYRANVANKMNEVMKVLTIIATLFIPITFVAGVYGMNFNHDASRWNMPELYWFLGYPAALVLMALIAGGMLLFFRKKGWLG